MNYRETEFFSKQGIYMQKVIARGSTSIIFLVHSLQHDCDLILKRCFNFIFSEKDLDNFIALNNPSFVKLYQYFKFSGSFYLLMEYCPTDLKKMIEEIDVSKEDTLRIHIKEVVQAVYSCHNLNIPLVDFNLSNFLVNNAKKIKLNIFGISKTGEEQINTFSNSLISTNYFLAPELLTQSDFNPLCSDIWSLGCIIYFMATKTLPFSSKDMKELKQQIKSGEYNDNNIKDEQIKEVISKCLAVNPRKRFTAKGILKLRYFGRTEGIRNNRTQTRIDYRKSVFPVARQFSVIKINNNNLKECSVEPNWPSFLSEVH